MLIRYTLVNYLLKTVWTEREVCLSSVVDETEFVASDGIGLGVFL